MIGRWLVAFARFWWAFVVGDEWRIAAGVVAVVAVSLALVRAGLAHDVIAVGVSVAVVLLSGGALLLEAARQR